MVDLLHHIIAIDQLVKGPRKMSGTDEQNFANFAPYLKIYYWMIRFIGALAILFLIAGVVVSFLNFRFMQNALPAAGTVMYVQSERTGSNSIQYHPILQFDGIDGISYVASTYMASTKYNFTVGQELPVLYLPSDPEVMKVDSWFGRWGLGAVFVCAAVFFRLIANVTM